MVFTFEEGGVYVLSLSEFQKCNIFKEKIFKNLQGKRDVNVGGLATLLQHSRSSAGVRSLEKDESLLHGRGHRYFAISPVKLPYLQRGTIERGAELYSPCKEVLPLSRSWCKLR